MAVDAPAHLGLHLASYSVSLSYVSVTARTLDARLYVRLVREEDIGVALEPVDPSPRRLFAALGECGKLLDLGAVGFDRRMTNHARVYVWYRRVRSLVGVLVTEGALKTRTFLA